MLRNDRVKKIMLFVFVIILILIFSFFCFSEEGPNFKLKNGYYLTVEPLQSCKECLSIKYYNNEGCILYIVDFLNDKIQSTHYIQHECGSNYSEDTFSIVQESNHLRTERYYNKNDNDIFLIDKDGDGFPEVERMKMDNALNIKCIKKVIAPCKDVKMGSGLGDVGAP